MAIAKVICLYIVMNIIYIVHHVGAVVKCGKEYKKKSSKWVFVYNATVRYKICIFNTMTNMQSIVIGVIYMEL